MGFGTISLSSNIYQMLLLWHRKMENKLISNADCKFTGDSWPSAEDIKTALKHTKAPVSDNPSTNIIIYLLEYNPEVLFFKVGF